MIRNLFLLTIALGLALTTPARAQDDDPPPIYEVEVVIFAYTSPAAGDEELWPRRLLVPRLKGVLELLPPPRRSARSARRLTEDVGSRLAAPAPPRAAIAFGTAEDLSERFELLDPSTWRLAEEARRIDRSGRYRVLWHNAWRQPGLDAGRALAVHVRAGSPVPMPLIDLTDSLDLETWLESPPLPEVPGPFGESRLLDRLTGFRMPPRLLVPPGPGMIRIYPLDGSLRLEMGRYLHLYSDLVLTEPVSILPSQDRRGYATRSGATLALQSYPVRSHRRMRSGEMHHIDHPMLGILVLTTRFETDESAGRAAAGVIEDSNTDEAVDEGR